ncbi:MAG: ABC transporter substrate-binding protein [Pseudomonadota bacterium]
MSLIRMAAKAAPRPVLLLVAAAVLALTAPGAGAAMTDEGRAIIKSIQDGFLRVYTTKGITRTERERKFGNLFIRHFDFRTVGKWVMGRPWRTATPAQRDAYLKEFQTYLVKTYIVQIGSFEEGETVKIVSAKPDNKGVVVTSLMIRPHGKEPIEVKWRLRRKKSGRLKVRDVVIENISMALNQRREFAAVYQKRGGTVDGLIAAIREKIAELDRRK